MKTGEEHILAYRNTLLTSDEGRYVLGHLLARLNYFGPCHTESDMALRNAATELLEDCGCLFVAHADTENAEKSIAGFVEAVAGLNVMSLVEQQEKGQQENQDNIV